ncbi:GNAT family N-acetyltransferase [Deinococcus sp.]|uniref:GNAT family N-acetyltransferase n=1 Tax=Deinococcus sp. TaxID=47478 RepID=UPI003CC54FF1
MNDLTVCDAQSADAPALARLLTAAYLGQWTTTTGEIERRIHLANPNTFILSAQLRGEVLAGLSASAFDSAPGGLRIQLYGDPAAFTPLYLEALIRASQQGFTRLLSVVREDYAPQVAFLNAAAFRNAYQSWGAHLNLSIFDFGPYQSLEERHFLDGTEVLSFVPESEDAPWEALYALHEQGVQDTPRNPTTTSEVASLEQFRARVASGRVFAALRRGEVLAYTAFELGKGFVETSHTATRREWRGRGLATLTKATALRWAREAGYARASTGGNVANLPMLRVNQALGYRPEGMWLSFVKDVTLPA